MFGQLGHKRDNSAVMQSCKVYYTSVRVLVKMVGRTQCTSLFVEGRNERPRLFCVR